MLRNYLLTIDSLTPSVPFRSFQDERENEASVVALLSGEEVKSAADNLIVDEFGENNWGREEDKVGGEELWDGNEEDDEEDCEETVSCWEGCIMQTSAMGMFMRSRMTHTMERWSCRATKHRHDSRRSLRGTTPALSNLGSSLFTWLPLKIPE